MDLPQPARRLYLTAASRSYALLAPSASLVCPRELSAQLGGTVQVVPPLAAQEEALDGAPLIDLSLRASTGLALKEDLSSRPAPSAETLVPQADSRWVQCAQPIPPLPSPDAASAERSIIDGTISRFTERRIRARLEATLELPPLPQATQRILALSGDPDGEVQDLIDIVEQDASLAARIVGWANSPFYGAPGGVSTIHDAVVRVIGYRGVLALAMGLTVGQSIPSPVLPAHGFPSYWIEALLTASVMENLLRRAPQLELDPGHAYLVGLLCNFGTLVLGHTFPPQYQRVCDLQSANRHVLYSHCDVAVLGLDREMIASALLTSWALPEAVTQPIREQHFEESTLPMARLLRCARHLLATVSLSSVPDQGLPSAVARELDLPEDALLATLEQVQQPREELETLARVFQRGA